MIRPLFLVTVTGFWLASMGQLIHREFFQLAPLKTPYEILSIQSGSLREEYRGIHLGGNLIGFMNTALEQLTPPGKAEPGETAPEPREEEDLPEDAEFELRQNTYMTFLFLGQEREMLTRSRALLDNRLELKAFELKIMSGEYSTDMKGRILNGQMELTIESRQSAPVVKKIPVQEPLFYSESLPMIWTPSNLKPGRQGRLRVWNPLLLNLTEIEFRVGGSEKMTDGFHEAAVYPVTLSENGVETRYWCTPEGVVLKFESPTGLVMIKEDAWKIFDALRTNRKALTDLPNLYSIPAGRELPPAEKIRSLNVRIRTPESELGQTTERDNLEDLSDLPRIRPENPELAPFLAPEEFIQSADPQILAAAEKIAGGEKSLIRTVEKLTAAVHTMIEPTPTVSIPSALQVLSLRKGDCNEYTVLFTALARALDIPAKTSAGVVYQNGRFFYHAWPEIYAGRWIPVDPTFGQVPADAAHIKLTEGSLEDQVNLIQKIGKISIDVLDVQSA